MMTSRHPEVAQRERLIRLAFVWSDSMTRDAFVLCSAEVSAVHTSTHPLTL